MRYAVSTMARDVLCCSVIRTSSASLGGIGFLPSASDEEEVGKFQTNC